MHSQAVRYGIFRDRYGTYRLIDTPKSPRIVPGAASAGFVAPMRLRPTRIISSPTTIWSQTEHNMHAVRQMYCISRAHGGESWTGLQVPALCEKLRIDCRHKIQFKIKQKKLGKLTVEESCRRLCPCALHSASRAALYWPKEFCRRKF